MFGGGIKQNPVRICHALERFYFGIYMFNHNTSPRQSAINDPFSALF
jgi:hypothetical protein